MNTKKIFIGIIAASSIFGSNSAFAQFATPSLTDQMNMQAEVAKQAHKDRIAYEADQNLERIRAANREKQALLAGKILPSDNTVVANFSDTERQAALNRTVTRNPITTSSTISTPTSTNTHISTADRSMTNVDLARVEQAWLGWVNDLRASQGLAPYNINSKLGLTAQEWSEFSRDRGYITHGRPGDGCVGEKNYVCYNFKAIDQWFTNRGINPTIINRSKHTENLGLGAYRCNSADCTDAAIKAIRKTFDFFYSEKSYNGVHYRTMISPNFTDIGLGLTAKNGTYYLTIHYSTPLK